jgi:hypothetical protein
MALGNVSPLLQWVDFAPYCAQERHHLFQDKERELALIPPGVLDGKVEVKP